MLAVLAEREMELRVLGKVYAAGSKAPLALQCGKGAGKSYYFKVPPLHYGHFVEGGREGRETGSIL